MRGIDRRSLAVVVLAATFVLIVPAHAAASPAWLTPQDVSLPGLDASSPQLALDAAGDVLAVWLRSDGANTVAQAAARPAGGSWGQPLTLSAPGQNAIQPQVAIDRAGNGVAIWTRRNGTNWVVQAATRPFGGSWSAPQDLSSGSYNGFVPQVAFDSSGNALAAWILTGAGDDTVQTATRPPGGSWSSPQDILGGNGQTFSDLHLALNQIGDAVAIWSSAASATIHIRAATRPAGGSWSASQELTHGPSETDAWPDVALDQSGDAVAVWGRFNPGPVVIQSAIRPAGGTWSEPEDLSVGTAITPQIAMDSTGNAVAVWTRSNGSRSIIEAATRPFGGSWGEPEGLSDPSRDAVLPQAAVDVQGNAVAVWRGSDGANAIIQAAMRPAGGTWSSPEDLSAPGHDADKPDVRFDPAGNAVAVWQRFNGANVIIQAAAYDAAGPVLAQLSIPERGVAGSPLSFTVSPCDVWSPLGPGPFWTFGDGGSAVGNTVSHTYVSPGTFVATVMQADTLGNTSSASASVSVGAAQSPPPPPPPQPPPPPPPAPAPPPPPPPSARCVVPRVIGLKLARARVRIRRARCSVGRIRRTRSRRVGRVIAQTPRPGTRLRLRGRVALVVGRR